MRATIHSFVLISLTLAYSAVQAAVPGSLNYQAFLTDPLGGAINGDRTITFSIYNVDVGGTFLWTDTLVVPVEQGLLSVTLGGPGNPFPAGLFDTPLWVGIAVDGDGEMTPRRALTTVGFAFEADNALTLQGQGPSAFDQGAHVVDTANPHAVDAVQIGAATAADIANLQSQLDAALASIATLQSELTAANASIATVQTDLATETSDRIADVDAEEAARIADVDAEEVARMAADVLQDTAIAAIQANSVLALDGVLTLPDAITALFTGVNVRVVNGMGTTDGNPNGLGNLIVGYDAVDTDSPICSLGAYDNQTDCQNNGGVWASSHKSGSHNVVVGDRHNYSRFGGLVVGYDNNITGGWSSVSGGQRNTASGVWASISGGDLGIARGDVASVTGGQQNTASGIESSVSGGQRNTAQGDFSVVSGGADNLASGPAASVSGGGGNTASGSAASVSGGVSNEASFAWSSVSGGQSNTASGFAASVSGGFTNLASGDLTSASGGESNIAGGFAASVSGGDNNNAIGNLSNVSGGFSNEASGPNSSVSGGSFNRAIASRSSVSGGFSNDASGTGSNVSAGSSNEASGLNSSVNGGQLNTASGDNSSILGGDGNTATQTIEVLTGRPRTDLYIWLEPGENATVNVGSFEHCGFAGSCMENGEAIDFDLVHGPNDAPPFQVCLDPPYSECSNGQGKARLTNETGDWEFSGTNNDGSFPKLCFISCI